MAHPVLMEFWGTVLIQGRHLGGGVEGAFCAILGSTWMYCTSCRFGDLGLREELKEAPKKLKTVRLLQNQTALDKLISAFLSAYPIINASIEMWTLVLQVAYVVSKSQIHSPWLFFAGCKLLKLTPADIEKFGDGKLELQPNARWALIGCLILEEKWGGKTLPTFIFVFRKKDLVDFF